MALPPTIPTSFVPHPASASDGTRRFKTDYTGAFGFFMYGLLALVFVLAIAVFFYGRILASSKAAKDTDLQKKEAAINPATAEGFVKLKNRLTSSGTLLGSHTAFSGFLTALGTLLPASVRFTSLHVQFDSSGVPQVSGSGVAKSFNALAAASTALAKDGRLKDVIFSNLTISTKDNSVAFSLSASLAPALVAFTL